MSALLGYNVAHPRGPFFVASRMQVGYRCLIMPWVRRAHESYRLYWIFAGIASVMVGLFIGYSPSNDKDKLITIVERQLTQSQREVRMLEKRLKVLEAKLGIDDTVGESSPNVQSSY